MRPPASKPLSQQTRPIQVRGEVSPNAPSITPLFLISAQSPMNPMLLGPSSLHYYSSSAADHHFSASILTIQYP